jgi:hypothetical protein
LGGGRDPDKKNTRDNPDGIALAFPFRASVLGGGAGSQKKKSQSGEEGSFGRASPAQREKDSGKEVRRKSRSSEKMGKHDPIISMITIIAINIRI